MLILAIDTALEACAVAVLDTETSALVSSETQLMARGHAEALMPMVDRVVKSAGIGFMQLDRIAVTVGPGSFTGLRVGISAARGLALAAGKDVVGVTTLSAYAAPDVAQDDRHPVVSAIDARHDHVYFQMVSGSGEVLIAPDVRSVAAAVEAASEKTPRLVGNAARLLAERWPAHASPPHSVNATAAPDIGWVAWLGAAANPANSRARPFYLRAPDAKPQVTPLQQSTALPP
jgi:tRNA threonylcarbamoyladenosine biosynthesis protein TsaB